MSEPGPGDSDTTYSVSDMSDTLLSICRCVANHHKSLSTMLCESALTNLHIVIWFSDMSEPENNCSYKNCSLLFFNVDSRAAKESADRGKILMLLVVWLVCVIPFRNWSENRNLMASPWFIIASPLVQWFSTAYNGYKDTMLNSWSHIKF